MADAREVVRTRPAGAWTCVCRAVRSGGACADPIPGTSGEKLAGPDRLDQSRQDRQCAAGAREPRAERSLLRLPENRQLDEKSSIRRIGSCMVAGKAIDRDKTATRLESAGRAKRNPVFFRAGAHRFCGAIMKRLWICLVCFVGFTTKMPVSAADFDAAASATNQLAVDLHR